MTIYFQNNNQVKTSTGVLNVSNKQPSAPTIDFKYGTDRYIANNYQFAGIFSNGRKKYKRTTLVNN